MNEAGEPIIDPEKCIGCVKCVKICPVQAIEMFFTPEEQKTVLRDLQSQLDDAYNAGKGNSAGLLTYLKYGAYGVGIFAVVKGGIYIKDKFFRKSAKQT